MVLLGKLWGKKPSSSALKIYFNACQEKIVGKVASVQGAVISLVNDFDYPATVLKDTPYLKWRNDQGPWRSARKRQRQKKPMHCIAK